MNISKRLSRLAAMVTEGSRLADVGTDHGYVPLCLYRQGRIPSAIAMDINEGPLERARAHIREAGLEHYIETRLSDGLHALRAGEADTVLIAGMGGGLTERILTDGKGVLETVRELVLQPQSEIWRVRRFLYENGWRIVCEDIVLINHGDIVLSGNLDQIKREFGHNRLVIGLGPDCQEPEQLLREHMADMIEVVGRRKDQVIAEMKEACTRERLLTGLLERRMIPEEFGNYEPSLTEIFVERAGDQA